MNKVFKIFSIMIGCMLSSIILLLVILNLSGMNEPPKQLPPIKHTKSFQSKAISGFSGRLKVMGNRIVNTDGEAVILKGLMAPDPQKIDYENNFNETYYKKIFESGGNVIRIPVHPDRWVKDKDYFWRYLVPLVTWAGKYNNYAVIDLHFIGNIATGAGNEMPDIKENSREFTLNFWKQTAAYFKDAPNVIFEICNEPAQISSEEWHKSAEDIVSVIRKTGAKQLIIVGGIDYSYDLSWVKKTPVKYDNIAYAAHVYPSKKDWDYYFGDVSEKYPVLITEWGFVDQNESKTKQSYLVGDADSFGKPFIKYLNDRGIGWIACWYDDGWEPAMFKDNFKGKTNYGNFVFSNLKH